MATNQIMFDPNHRAVVVTHPTSPTSGQPVRYVNMVGIALTDEGKGQQDDPGKTTVNFGPGAWLLAVKGANDGGNVAVAIGDALFYSDADAPALTRKATAGYFFGYAGGAVVSGATTTIEVYRYAAYPGKTPA